MKRLILLACLMTPWLAGGASPAPLRIVVFGDSTAAAREVGQPLSGRPSDRPTTCRDGEPAVPDGPSLYVFGDQLRDRLAPSLPGGAEVLNRSTGGMTSGTAGQMKGKRFGDRAHALDRVTSVRSLNPDIVILQLGINDAYQDEGREGDSRVPLAQYRENLHALVAKLTGGQAPRPALVLMTPNPHGRPQPGWRNGRLSDYAQAVRETAARHPYIRLVDVWRLYEEYVAVDPSARGYGDLLLDGTHPNARGHAMTADALQTLIEENGWTTSASLSWNELPPTPDGIGFASPFSGVHNGTLLLGGGANFPVKPPWENGPKVYYDTLYALVEAAGATPQWITAGTLPERVAYGVSITAPEGVVCIGGGNGQEGFRSCFMLTWDPETRTVRRTALPDLSEPLQTGSGILYREAIYVAGGKNADGETRRLLKLAWPGGTTWERLPDFPGPPRNAAALSAAKGPGGRDMLFLFGGLSYPASEPEPFVGRDVLGFDLASGQWEKLGPIQLPGGGPLAFCSAQAFALDEEHVLLTGGRGNQNLAAILVTLRHKKEAEEAGDKERFARLDEVVDDYFLRTEFRFNSELLLYHAPTGRWRQVGALPTRPRTGSNLVPCEGGFILPSGEIRPGVRTPTVFRAVWRP